MSKTLSFCFARTFKNAFKSVLNFEIRIWDLFVIWCLRFGFFQHQVLQFIAGMTIYDAVILKWINIAYRNPKIPKNVNKTLSGKFKFRAP